MTPNNNPQTPEAEYRQAEQLIEQSIAKMGDESHIEYGSILERNQPKSKWKDNKFFIPIDTEINRILCTFGLRKRSSTK